MLRIDFIQFQHKLNKVNRYEARDFLGTFGKGTTFRRRILTVLRCQVISIMKKFRQSDREPAYGYARRVGGLLLFFALYSVQALGCKCLPPQLTESYLRSDFVAVVKFAKVSLDPTDSEYHDVEIETLNVFKGETAAKMRINTRSSTSCAFSVTQGTVWLVFARKGQDGKPMFGSCSGSMQIGREYDISKYPIVAKDGGKGIGLKLAVLTFLKNKVSTNTNEYNLTLAGTEVQPKPEKIEQIREGFENENLFSVYEFEINEDLTIGEITAIQAFDNPELASIITEYLRKNARVYRPTIQSIPEKTKLILVYYYYPTEGIYPSSISLFHR